jgi:hypothetical protein
MNDMIHRRSASIHPPFARPGERQPLVRSNAESELPSIDDYLDELPSIDDYVWAGDTDADDMRSIDEYLEDSLTSVALHVDAHAAAPDFDDDGWALTGWQTFDWSGAALLAPRTGGPASSRNPRIIDRDSGQGIGERERGREITPSADEVARALDGIAQRIRSGELKIDQLTGAPPEATMAAALAALLRMRD